MLSGTLGLLQLCIPVQAPHLRSTCILVTHKCLEVLALWGSTAFYDSSIVWWLPSILCLDRYGEKIPRWPAWICGSTCRCGQTSTSCQLKCLSQGGHMSRHKAHAALVLGTWMANFDEERSPLSTERLSLASSIDLWNLHVWPLNTVCRC